MDAKRSSKAPGKLRKRKGERGRDLSKEEERDGNKRRSTPGRGKRSVERDELSGKEEEEERGRRSGRRTIGGSRRKRTRERYEGSGEEGDSREGRKNRKAPAGRRRGKEEEEGDDDDDERISRKGTSRGDRGSRRHMEEEGDRARTDSAEEEENQEGRRVTKDKFQQRSRGRKEEEEEEEDVTETQGETTATQDSEEVTTGTHEEGEEEEVSGTAEDEGTSQTDDAARKMEGEEEEDEEYIGVQKQGSKVEKRAERRRRKGLKMASSPYAAKTPKSRVTPTRAKSRSISREGRSVRLSGEGKRVRVSDGKRGSRREQEGKRQNRRAGEGLSRRGSKRSLQSQQDSEWYSEQDDKRGQRRTKTDASDRREGAGGDGRRLGRKVGMVEIKERGKEKRAGETSTSPGEEERDSGEWGEADRGTSDAEYASAEALANGADMEEVMEEQEEGESLSGEGSEEALMDGEDEEGWRDARVTAEPKRSRMRPKSAVRPSVLSRRRDSRGTLGAAGVRGKARRTGQGKGRTWEDGKGSTHRISISSDLPRGESRGLSTGESAVTPGEERTHEMLLDSSGRDFLTVEGAAPRLPSPSSTHGRDTGDSGFKESGFSDGLAVGQESDVDGLTDPERQTEDEEDTEAGRRKTRTRRRKDKHRGRSGEAQLDLDSQVRGVLPALDIRQVESMDSSLRRKTRKMASPSTEVSITQAMQNTMRKYALERRLFQQLLELKRVQIRNSRANEHVLIKRMVDTFQKEGMLLGLRGYAGPYNFNGYEKYLYDQLRFLQSSQGIKIPAFRPSDDVEKLSRAIRRAEIKELPDPLQNNLDAHTCNHTTHRCHHAAHAYTGIPCAAYIGYRRKRPVTTVLSNNKQVSLPKIPGTQSGGGGSSLTGSPGRGLEGSIGGRVRQGEPVGLRNYDPKNPLTVELQPSSPRNKEQQSADTDSPERSVSAPEMLPSDASGEPDSLAVDSLAPETRQDLNSTPVETRTEA